VIPLPELDDISCILVDEAQFLSVPAIDQLHHIAHCAVEPVRRNIPVICYGLRADFKTYAFPAAKRLFELADSIEEIKTTCYYCERKAIFNLKLLNGKPTKIGPSVELGCEEKYLPACAGCYYAQHAAAGQ
jgi:thymidine kinase